MNSTNWINNTLINFDIDSTYGILPPCPCHYSGHGAHLVHLFNKKLNSYRSRERCLNHQIKRELKASLIILKEQITTMHMTPVTTRALTQEHAATTLDQTSSRAVDPIVSSDNDNGSWWFPKKETLYMVGKIALGTLLLGTVVYFNKDSIKGFCGNLFRKDEGSQPKDTANTTSGTTNTNSSNIQVSTEVSTCTPKSLLQIAMEKGTAMWKSWSHDKHKQIKDEYEKEKKWIQEKLKEGKTLHQMVVNNEIKERLYFYILHIGSVSGEKITDANLGKPDGKYIAGINTSNC